MRSTPSEEAIEWPPSAPSSEATLPLAQIYDAGDPAPKRKLTFDIDVTDEGETHGLPIRERRTFRNWRRIGNMVFDEAVASYNGDFVIHFHHPPWRDDRNDPSTAVRRGGRRVAGHPTLATVEPPGTREHR